MGNSSTNGGFPWPGLWPPEGSSTSCAHSNHFQPLHHLFLTHRVRSQDGGDGQCPSTCHTRCRDWSSWKPWSTWSTWTAHQRHQGFHMFSPDMPDMEDFPIFQPEKIVISPTKTWHHRGKSPENRAENRVLWGDDGI